MAKMIDSKQSDSDVTFGLDLVAPTKRASTNRRSSLFNLVSSTAPKAPTIESSYEKSLTAEAKQWHSLIKTSVISNSKLANENLRVSKDDLSKNSHDFVNAAPDFMQFQRESLQFAKLAEFFATRVEDLKGRQEDMMERIVNQQQQSVLDLAIDHHTVSTRMEHVNALIDESYD